MIGKNHLSAIADEQVAIDFNASVSESRNFFEEGDRVEHHAITDNAPAILPQHAARNELEYEPLAINDDGMPGVVSAGVTRDHGKSFREYIDDLALAFVSPLRADYDRSLACLQMLLLILTITTSGLHTHPHCSET